VKLKEDVVFTEDYEFTLLLSEHDLQGYGLSLGCEKLGSPHYLRKYDSQGFWRNSKVGVIGGGSWGSVLAHLSSANCREVRVWIRNEDLARAVNATRSHTEGAGGVQFASNVQALVQSREFLREE
jgi:hypothetical protein